ncbi:hypothetical protein K503DRAFT_168504 [Rhizopogon vinicolor AM-OR11-026]|uniref:Uncharacterized protein n=1 Tax=Rhizopogon vinicolor AM-OR11-026 TaxID=1314800 RepID=A0A1B7NEN2_9AGAM|nr:hypothetical protein K503DRAFT_168504 [Rhizopogon vinicolor AM-OR11-026]
MSIRRKSTTHDLATLRLHPDGTRVQQSSVNRRLRKARSTVPDIRGNWIARDAGGRADVGQTRTRTATASAQAQDEDEEIFDIHLSDGLGEEGLTVRTNAKGKQKATESDAEDSSGERTGKNSRAKKRLGFTQDSSFLAPSPSRFIRGSGSESESSSEDASSESASEAVKITLPDPSPELLKCIHHFASRYYQEKGVLSDRSRDHRGERKARRSKKGEANIHYQTTTKPALWTRHSSLDGDGEDSDDDDDGHDDEWEDEDDDEMEDVEEGEGASRQEGHLKDMYKALDGSALVAIGIILQEQIAHTMTAGFSSSHSRRVHRRDDHAE